MLGTHYTAPERAAQALSMMHTMKLYVVIFASLLLSGCASVKPISAPARQSHQRFLPVPAENLVLQEIPWHGYFALDTDTGTLCLTMRSQHFSGAAAWANDVPVCNDIH